MSTCEQTQGQTVLQHGESVRSYTFDLLNHMRYGTPLRYEWKLPDWIAEHRDFILESLPSDQTLDLYTTYHDIGKPFCLEVDSEGKRHFPDHAEVSFQIFSKLFDDELAAELIRRDMDIHLLKADGVDAFCESPHAITSLIVGLAEVHSNSNLFGGIESTSFKIKNKCLTQRGKQILKIKNK